MVRDRSRKSEFDGGEFPLQFCPVALENRLYLIIQNVFVFGLRRLEGDGNRASQPVSDPLTLDCEAALGTLATTTSSTYQCTEPGVTASYTNSATATGTT